MSETTNLLQGLKPKEEGRFIPNVWYLVCLATKMFMGKLVPNRGRNGSNGVLEFSIAGGGVERITPEEVLTAYFLTPEQVAIVLQRLLVAFQAPEDEEGEAGVVAAPQLPLATDIGDKAQVRQETQVRLLVVPVLAEWNLPEMAIKLLTYLLGHINKPVSEQDLFAHFGWNDEVALKAKRDRLRRQRDYLKERVPKNYGMLCFNQNGGDHTLTWIVTSDMGVAVEQVSSE